MNKPIACVISILLVSSVLSHLPVSQAEAYPIELVLYNVPAELYINDVMDFTGKLKNFENAKGALIYIMEKDKGVRLADTGKDESSKDDILAIGISDKEGNFKATWQALPEHVDKTDSQIEVYALFEPKAGTISTIFSSQLFVIDIITESDVTPANVREPNPHIDIHFNDWTKKRLGVYIIVDTDSQAQIEPFVGDVQAAIDKWSTELQEHSGNDNAWIFDVTVSYGRPTYYDPNKPMDIYIDLSYDPDDICHGAGGYGGSYSHIHAFPVGAKICPPYSHEGVYWVTMHEFAHTLGLGHTYHLPGDMMCSVDYHPDNPQTTFSTCGLEPIYFDKPYTEGVPSLLDVYGLLYMYGYEGFEVPNRNIQFFDWLNHPYFVPSEPMSMTLDIDITKGASSKTTDAYFPNPATVLLGDSVVWRNTDSQPHTVTSGSNGQPDGEFDSSPNFNPLMAPGATFTHKFTEIGQYSYYCALHPNMVAKVDVVRRADTLAPSILAPPDITKDATGILTPVSLGAPIVNDDMDSSPTVTNTAPSGGFPLGTTTVSWTAVDDAGNSASDIQIVTIRDATPPSISATPKVTLATLPACGNLPPAAVAASGNDGNIPQNVIDNDLTTRWSSYGKGSTITLDAGSKMVICSAEISWHAGNTRTNTFVVSISDDGTTFKPVFAGKTTGTTLQQEKYEFADTVGRYLRVTVNGNSLNDWASITEIDANGYSFPALPTVTDKVDKSPLVYNNAPSAGFPSGSPSVVVIWTAKDASGNTNSATQLLEVVSVDTTRPAIAISSPSTGSTATGPSNGVKVSLTGTASDSGSGVQKVELKSLKAGIGVHSYQQATPNAAGNWGTWSHSLTFTQTGTYIITARATDKVGNQNWYSITVDIEFSASDTTRPAISVTSPATGSTITGPSIGVKVSLKGTAADSGSGVQKVELKSLKGNLVVQDYLLASPSAPGNWGSWSQTLTFTESGTYTITARATDKSGNQNWYTVIVKISFEADATIPTVSITSPQTGASFSGPSGVPKVINLAGIAADSGSGIKNVELKSLKSGILVHPYQKASSTSNLSNWTHQLTFSQAGPYTITARATDMAGNQNWYTITVHITLN